ncbi:MAG: hypothetical protein IJD78_07250 [Clostridia bacterium]|nr:hypothetical protein [Clostridia bacterium]MBQ3044350.1 hypothetical protein [Clostridia bacterium]
MKKHYRPFIAFILVFTVLFSAVSMPAYAGNETNSPIHAVTDVLGGIVDGLIKMLGFLTPTPDYPTVEEYFSADSEAFYEGTKNFIDSVADGAKWSLGFGKESVVPDNLLDGSKEYYTGGYFTQKVNGVFDDQKAVAIALNDGSGRGTTVFASIDGVGVANGDVRAIRKAVEQKLKEKGIESDINAININATHCHTVIDTQGIGLDLLPKIFFSFFGGADRSMNTEFLEVMIDRASDAIVEAYINRETGSLYYFETAGMGKDEERGLYTGDEYPYLVNKRYYTEGYQNFFACFKFVPDNGNSAATVIANIGAHPTIVDETTNLLSADFPAFMEEKINAAGMNFMFIQGAQAPVSVNKWAEVPEATVAEVDAKKAENPVAGDYETAILYGYEYARLILEAQDNLKEIEPILNVRMTEYAVNLDTGLFGYGATEGFIGTTTVEDSSSKTGYSIITEAGYIEIGKDIVLLTVPGEIVPQLIYGNVVSAEDSYLGTEWPYEVTSSLVPEGKTVLVMGLCNDAIGYILPDNDFAHFITDVIWDIDGADKVFGAYHRHYEELLSAGSSAGSTTVSVLNEMVRRENP